MSYEYNETSSRRGWGTNILMILILIVTGVMIYLVAQQGNNENKITVHGVASPDITAPQPQPADTQNTDSDMGLDGLGNPSSYTTGTLDEIGAGTANVATFERDINDDGQPDRITRTRIETGTAHGYDEYKIELNQNGKYVDITPNGFRTIDGAECSLQKLKFSFAPDFRVVKISRPMGDTWITPTMAVKTTYAVHENKLRVIKSEDTKTICHVADLI